MAQRTVTIFSTVGLHARPAAIFSKAAAASGLSVTIAKAGGTPVNAASILSVLGLSASHGDTIDLVADGEGAEAVLEELAGILSSEE